LNNVLDELEGWLLGLASWLWRLLLSVFPLRAAVTVGVAGALSVKKKALQHQQFFLVFFRC
jgi:hypothetical protein